MRVKNVIPEYNNPEERMELLQKQYNLLQRRFLEAKRKNQPIVKTERM